VENEKTLENPAQSFIRHSVTQKQIDDILNNELKDFKFPVKPVYNPRIKANGRTVYRTLSSGQNIVTKIEIGKQDRPDKRHLTDTLLHEFYEADIVTKKNELYTKLDAATDIERHKWINRQITKHFEELGWRK